MPATEAVLVSDDRVHYEFAFHVLPTVAEGEVATVVADLKREIEAAGAELTIEEEPRRVELAYEIVKPIEGKNRRFSSAYFGWMRFTAEPEKVPELTSELEAVPQLLRSLIIKLTRVEEEHPFYFHAAADADKQIQTIGDDSPVELAEEPAEATGTEEVAEVESADEPSATETEATPDDAELDASLEKITSK